MQGKKAQGSTVSSGSSDTAVYLPDGNPFQLTAQQRRSSLPSSLELRAGEREDCQWHRYRRLNEDPGAAVHDEVESLTPIRDLPVPSATPLSQIRFGPYTGKYFVKVFSEIDIHMVPTRDCQNCYF